MRLELAENIRMNRKQRKLTQEQLAEILGVTTGAVYKWESGLSVPELDLIVEMADFFDCSVDALLGFRMDDSRLPATIRRIRSFVRNRDPQAVTEAEKALQKYPNSFELVYFCAMTFFAFGSTPLDANLLRRSLELMERSIDLLPQNKDPEIGESTIIGEMAEVYLLLGEKEKGIDLLKQHNTGGIFNESIGINLIINLDRPEEAEHYLNSAMLKSTCSLTDTVCGMVYVFFAHKDYSSAEDILMWVIGLIKGLKKDAASGLTDKVFAEFLAMLACALKKEGKNDAVLPHLHEASEKAARFDASPDYSIGTIRFVSDADEAIAIDLLGVTADDAILNILNRLGDEELIDEWRDICDER